MITNLTPDGIVVSRLFLWLWPRSKGVGGWGPLKESEINRYFQFWHRFGAYGDLTPSKKPKDARKGRGIASPKPKDARKAGGE